MKKILILFNIITFSVGLFANVEGKLTDKSGAPAVGVNVYWLGNSQVVLSDKAGEFVIPEIEGVNQLVFRSTIYSSDTLTVINFNEPIKLIMREAVELSELSVVGKLAGNVKLRSAVIQTENLSAGELHKAACCNLSESFETNASVDVSYSDAATGAKQIKLLGLSGNYVQMLTENIPNMRGISSAYGMGFIPGPWMESIQISKGTSSVINGYEAIAGQINVEYKKPFSSEKVAVNMFASDAGRMEANLNAAAILSPTLSTGVFLHASDELWQVDENKDGFMDMPMVKQYNFINRWFYKTNNYSLQVFLRALNESRMGGQTTGSYHIGIETKRYEFFLKNGYIFNAKKGQSVGLILSGSLHNQDAHYGLKMYDGEQGNLYANLIYQTSFGHDHKLSTGASFNYDNYAETLFDLVSTAYPRKEFVPGVFAEYTLNLDDKFTAVAGLRADYNSAYRAFVTPRLHLKYSVTEDLHIRGSVGKGYRSPNVLAENNFLLASNRKISIAPDLKMEEAWNYGLSIHNIFHVFERELSVLGEWYYTDFKQQVVIDMDSNPHAVSFANLNGGVSYSSSAQIEVSMEIVKGLSLTVAHRENDVRSTIGGQLREKVLASRSKSLITVSYQTPVKGWQIDFTTQFNGGGRLPDPDPTTSFWSKTFKPYTIMNAQVTKYFKTWSVYLGSENLTSFVQQNPIIDVRNPMSNEFDASMVWGPMHGRKIYVGFRWAL